MCDRDVIHDFSMYLRPCFNGNATVKVSFENGLYEHCSNWIVRSLWKNYRQQTNSEKKRFRDKYFSNFSRQHRDGRLKKDAAPTKTKSKRAKMSSRDSSENIINNSDIEMKDVAIIMEFCRSVNN